MMTFDQAISTFAIGREELSFWIEQTWVRPRHDEGGLHFDECDIARLELICELRRGLEINDEAIPVVLSLLDQLYATRNTLRHVGDVLSQLPDPTLEEVLAKLTAELAKD